MKIQKRVSNERGVDVYTFQINHEEATRAFKAMTEEEKIMIHDLQYSDSVSTILSILTLWAEKIEETQGGRARDTGAIYEG